MATVDATSPTPPPVAGRWGDCGGACKATAPSLAQQHTARAALMLVVAALVLTCCSVSQDVLHDGSVEFRTSVILSHTHVPAQLEHRHFDATATRKTAAPSYFYYSSAFVTMWGAEYCSFDSSGPWPTAICTALPFNDASRPRTGPGAACLDAGRITAVFVILTAIAIAVTSVLTGMEVAGVTRCEVSIYIALACSIALSICSFAIPLTASCAWTDASGKATNYSFGAGVGLNIAAFIVLVVVFFLYVGRSCTDRFCLNDDDDQSRSVYEMEQEDRNCFFLLNMGLFLMNGASLGVCLGALLTTVANGETSARPVPLTLSLWYAQTCDGEGWCGRGPIEAVTTTTCAYRLYASASLLFMACIILFASVVTCVLLLFCGVYFAPKYMSVAVMASSTLLIWTAYLLTDTSIARNACSPYFEPRGASVPLMIAGGSLQLIVGATFVLIEALGYDFFDLHD